MTSFLRKPSPLLRRAAFLVALCLAGAAHAQSADRRADELLSRGQKLFGEGKYQEAIEQLRAGYVISPQARFLYALGQAYRLNHQCKEAVRAYRDFLHADPSKAQAVATEQNIKRCGDEDPSVLAEPETPKPGVTPENPSRPGVVEQPSTQVATTSTTDHPATPTYKKWWVWTTVAAVVVVGAGLGVGLGLGLKKSSDSFNPTLPEVGPNAAALTVKF